MIEIYCPKCGMKLGTYDGKSTINKILKCKECHRRVVYHVDTGETEIKLLPRRDSLSGKRY